MKSEKANAYAITRKIKSTRVVYKCANLETDVIFTADIILPKTYTHENAALSKIKTLVDTEKDMPISIVSMEPVVRIYGLTEAELMQYGHEITENQE